MKKLLTLLFLFSAITVFSAEAEQLQNQSKNTVRNVITHEYKGTVVIDGVKVTNTLTVVDNAFKQHEIYLKAKQWVGENYDKRVNTSMGDNAITISAEFTMKIGYTLLLEFKDGQFNYVFTDNGKGSIEIQKNEQRLIEDLTKYIKTAKLKNNSW
jgi:hypothetical protein